MALVAIVILLKWNHKAVFCKRRQKNHWKNHFQQKMEISVVFLAMFRSALKFSDIYPTFIHHELRISIVTSQTYKP